MNNSGSWVENSEIWRVRYVTEMYGPILTSPTPEIRFDFQAAEQKAPNRADRRQSWPSFRMQGQWRISISSFERYGASTAEYMLGCSVARRRSCERVDCQCWCVWNMFELSRRVSFVFVSTSQQNRFVVLDSSLLISTKKRVIQKLGRV